MTDRSPLDMRMYYEPSRRGNRAMTGTSYIIQDEVELWEAAVEYFTSVEETPLWEESLGWYQGVPTTHDMAKARAMSVRAFALFLGVSEKAYSTWYDGKPQWRPTMDRIADVIKTQTYEGAMVGFFNSTIAARQLGLQEHVAILREGEAERERALSDEELLEALKSRGLPTDILETLDEPEEDEGEED